MGSSPSGSPTLPRSKNVGEQGGSKLPLFDEQSAPESRHRNTGVMPLDTDGYTYGYVFFRQQSDNEIRRGFFQVCGGGEQRKAEVFFGCIMFFHTPIL